MAVSVAAPDCFERPVVVVNGQVQPRLEVTQGNILEVGWEGLAALGVMRGRIAVMQVSRIAFWQWTGRIGSTECMAHSKVLSNARSWVQCGLGPGGSPTADPPTPPRTRCAAGHSDQRPAPRVPGRLQRHVHPLARLEHAGWVMVGGWVDGGRGGQNLGRYIGGLLVQSPASVVLPPVRQGIACWQAQMRRGRLAHQ